MAGSTIYIGTRSRLWATVLCLPWLLLGCGQGGQGGSTTGGISAAIPLAGSCSNGPTSAQISIFQENPKTSSSNASLAYSASLSSSYTVAATLSGLTGNCLLHSDRFAVLTDSLFPSQVASISSANQIYSPTQAPFQQINSFYYATLLKNLVSGTLGSNLSSMGQVSIDAHCNYTNNAYFSPASRRVCLGYIDVGSGKKLWAADDADVVVHEAGHAVNHALSSTSIMNSSGEAGAIDESIADYWALTLMNDGQLSEWFLGALGGVRDATQAHTYPSSMTYSVHSDSKVLTQVLWDLRNAGNLGRVTTDQLVNQAMKILPSATRFSDFYQAFYDASGPSFLNLSNAQRSLIVTKFTNKGLHRVDSAAGFRLSTSPAPKKQIYIIDDHTISAQVGGNCNGALDVGETALVLVNLENPNASQMGMGVANLTGVPAGITIPSGGGVGEFYKFLGAKDFVDSLPSGSTREDATIMASFLVRASTAGVKNFSLTFTPMYSDVTGAIAPNASVLVSFPVTVGTASTSSSCSSASLWP